MKLEGAIQKVVEKIKEKGTTQTETITSMWASLRLSPEDIELLAQAGFKDEVRRVLTNYTPPLETAKKVTFNMKTSPSILEEKTVKFRVEYLENTYFSVQDGSERSLFHFRVQDFDYILERNEDQINGLTKRSKVLAIGKKMLTKNNVSQVSQLPVEEQVKLNEEWMSVSNRKMKATA